MMITNISTTSIVMGLIDMFYSIKKFVCSLSLIKYIQISYSKYYNGKLFEPLNSYVSISHLNLKKTPRYKNSSLYLCKKDDFYITREIDILTGKCTCKSQPLLVETLKDLKNYEVDCMFSECKMLQDDNDNIKRVFNETRCAIISNTSFICIEYHHAKLHKSLSINLSKEYFVKGNVILSDIFVYRYLIYEYGKHVLFEDMNYTLVIIDDNVKIFSLTKNHHILLDLNGYTIIENNKYI